MIVVCRDEGVHRGCGRRIPEEAFERPSAHAPGCFRRLSILRRRAIAQRREKEAKRLARKLAR